MKRTVFAIIIGVAAVAFLACSYWCGFNQGTKSTADTTFKDSDTTVGRIDYPLIDVSFDFENEWVVIDRIDMFTEQEILEVACDKQELQLNKEWLRVLTFPTGRGTTPKGIIYVYKDGALIKEVPYSERYFENGMIRNAFQREEKDKVEERIGSKLPSSI